MKHINTYINESKSSIPSNFSHSFDYFEEQIKDYRLQIEEFVKAYEIAEKGFKSCDLGKTDYASARQYALDYYSDNHDKELPSKAFNIYEKFLTNMLADNPISLRKLVSFARELKWQKPYNKAIRR